MTGAQGNEVTDRKESEGLAESLGKKLHVRGIRPSNCTAFADRILPNMRPQTYRHALLAIAISAFLLRSWDLFHPFEFGHQGVNGASYGVIAQNYLKFGYGATALAPVHRGGDQEPSEFLYYLRHPPLVGLLLSVLFAAFGVSHVVARLPFIVLSVLGLLGTAHLTRKLTCERTALLAALVMAMLPAGAFYGSLVDVQGSLVMGFSVLATCAYLNHMESGKRKWLFLCLGLCVLAALTDWPGYLTLGLIGLHALLFGRRVLLSATAFGLGVLLFLLHLLQTVLATGKLGAGGPQTLSETLKHHSFYGLVARQGLMGVLLFLRSSALHLSSLYTIPGTALALVAPFVAFWHKRGKALDAKWAAVWLLSGMAILHILLFPEAATRHDYWYLYLLPPVSMGIACAVSQILRGDVGVFSRARRASATVVLVLTVAFGLVQSLLRMEKPEPFFMPLGQAFKKATSSQDRVLTCEYPHIALVFYSDRWIRGKICDDAFEVDPKEELENPITGEQSLPPAWRGLGIEKILRHLRFSNYEHLQVRYTKFVVPLHARSYPSHRHEKVLELLRSWHPSVITESDLGAIETFDLTRKR
jgi:hypothetical protein